MLFNGIKRKIIALLLLVASVGAVAVRLGSSEPLDQGEFEALYKTPLATPEAPLRVYHLGHSLVGHDMPAMLEQLAGEGHGHGSQLGWGSNLRQHWDPDVVINGFEESNQHVQHQDPHQAMASGDYDAVVLTETVEIRDSIKYHDPQGYLHKWAVAAWAGNPQTRVYLYETWHQLDDPEGWLTRIDLDLGRYWEGEILRRTLTNDNVTQPIYVIPGGQVMGAFVRHVEGAGGIGPITSRDDLFDDNIHFNDFGAYLMALAHYAVLYGRSPVGLPHGLAKANGEAAADPGLEAARAMQQIVWEVVTGYPPSGVAAVN